MKKLQAWRRGYLHHCNLVSSISIKLINTPLKSFFQVSSCKLCCPKITLSSLFCYYLRHVWPFDSLMETFSVCSSQHKQIKYLKSYKNYLNWLLIAYTVALNTSKRLSILQSSINLWKMFQTFPLHCIILNKDINRILRILTSFNNVKLLIKLGQ